MSAEAPGTRIVAAAASGDPDGAAAFEQWSGGGPAPATGAPEVDLPAGCSVVLCTYSRAAAVRRFLESLRQQKRRPDELIVVDASHDAQTEPVVRELAAREGTPRHVAYYRVSGRYRGLTRQRNFGLARVGFDLVAFFDDDTVLDPGCLGELERVLRAGGQIVGAGGAVDEPGRGQEKLWRLRRTLGIVGELTPGRYSRSGMSIPWSLLPSGGGPVEGDWLPGCAMIWRTGPARAEGFNDGFAGYAQGEDLDFSLRMRRRGRLVLVGSARLRHLQEPEGRPDAFRLGYMAIRNRFEIHRRGLLDRTTRDVVWFAYAWTADTLMLARHFLHPGRWGATLRQIGGRIRAAIELGREAMSAARSREIR
jgi:GT2 family glycosyltransferase